MLAPLVLSPLLLSVYVGAQSSRPPTKPTMDWTGGEGWDCCKWKVVEGKKFKLVDRNAEAYDYGCSSDCTYMTEGSDVQYCFKPGRYETECYNDEGSKPPFTGSKPPFTGSKPPMSSKPPGSKPPFTGSKPPMSSKPPGSKPPSTGSKPPMSSKPPGSSKPPMTGSTSAPGGGAGTTLPNPGGAAEERTLEIQQTWSQEPAGYTRTAKLAIPATSAGQKVPVVIHLHGNGGQGNTKPFEAFLGDDCVIVAPDGYERSWNVYSEKSKADDVQFILDLIAKIGQEIPAADMNNVNIAGSSNGAALTYLLLISTGADRPFKRAFPMVSSLIGPQYHDGQFWKFAESANAGEPNDFSVAMVPTFDDSFEYAHFHGTEDGLIKYEGQNPGPALLNNVEVIAAQLTDYIWAKAMGFTGAQIPDSDGVSVGTDAKPAQVYKYLDGRCRHYKLIGEGHGTGPSHPAAQEAIREMVLGAN